MSTLALSAPPRAGMDVLRALPERLARSGYGEFYASFNPAAPRRADWAAHRGDLLDDDLGALVDLFLLSQPVEEERLEARLGDLIEGLLDVRVLVRTGDGRLTTPDLVLLVVFGNWLLCQRPQVNPTLYFGDDSVALLLRLLPKPGGRCLDLCSGPGIQSLHCSRFARTVTAVEVNPVAAALARLNMILNQRDDRVRVHCGSLYEPVRGELFDTIVANPPLLPFPESIAYPFVGHGGEDGMRVTWRIMEGLPDALAPEGTAHLIGTCLSDGLLPLCADALAGWSGRVGMDTSITVLAHHHLRPGTEYFDGLATTAALSAGLKVEEVVSHFLDSLRAQDADHLCAYTLHVTPGAGRFRVRDLSRDGTPGLWYV